jgi:hypothetical protein
MPELPGLWSLTPIGALIGVIVLLYWLLSTGRLVTKSSHERELNREIARGDEWKEAHRVSEVGRANLQAQNSALMAGVRIADKFYKDFLPGVDEDTIPKITGGSDVAL